MKDVDQYGRAVTYVFVNGINVNLEQVKRGMVWAYMEYLDRPYISEFYEAEKLARQKRLSRQIPHRPGSGGRKIDRGRL